jgi:photosystem II stability/assembly factor-like uncharacterized protein
MPADDEFDPMEPIDPLDRWLGQPVRLLPPPPGTFELVTKRARRRRIRKITITAVSTAVVAAAVAVAVPVGLALHLGGSPSRGSMVAAGSSPTSAAAATPSGRALSPAKVSSHSAKPSAHAVPSAASTPAATVTAPVPANFVPGSVTWVSTSTGWVIGQAGTPGSCANANPDICTSVARTDDGGQTWQGVHAPDTSAPAGPDGVSGLRFLNGTYGWAFGPQLWATSDGGASWQQEDTGGLAVTDLETVDGRAYALFGHCPAATANSIVVVNCGSYTLETTTAGSDAWTPVGGVPAALPAGGSTSGSAVIELTDAAGFLAAPDGTLYSGPVNGGPWHRVATLPCKPGPGLNDGLPLDLMLAPAGYTSSGGTRLAAVCGQLVLNGETASVWMSNDGGASWANAGPSGVSGLGRLTSLAATSDGTLILSTSNGLYTLPLGATAWQAATLSNPAGKTYGFGYVGMTTPTQGVAIGGDPALHAIWMTSDGGQSWSVVPITGG